jgi:hypothetical protein
MGYLFRTIKKARWNRENKPAWLGINQVPADTFRDLQTREGQLSVWFIEDDLSNLNDVIVAVTSNKEHVEKCDYALFDEKECTNLGIQLEDCEGTTPLKSANSWHRLFTELTGAKLIELAKVIYYKGKRDRFAFPDVKGKILSVYSKGEIDESQLRTSMKASLGLIPEEICDSCKRPIFS